MLEYVTKPPSTAGRTMLSKHRLEELYDALLRLDSDWVKAPYTWLAPEAEGMCEDKLISRARNTANRLRMGKLTELADLKLEAVSRGADIYVRWAATEAEKRRVLKHLGDE